MERAQRCATALLENSATGTSTARNRRAFLDSVLDPTTTSDLPAAKGHEHFAHFASASRPRNAAQLDHGFYLDPRAHCAAGDPARAMSRDGLATASGDE